MKQYLGEKLNIRELECKKMVSRNAERPTFNSFKIGVEGVLMKLTLSF